MDAFESLLQKDYLLVLHFDGTVDSFEVQPVRIPVKGEIRKPLLAEVKRSDYRELHAFKYAPQFAAAKSYAQNSGWEFRPVDETEIRFETRLECQILQANH